MSIATMQKQLAASRHGEVELRTYFTDLCRTIGASMIADHDRLSLETTVDDSMVEANVSVSLGLIVTELVINALKHAFPDPDQTGEIRVDYSSKGKGWTLTVGDNGVGMPGDHPAAKPGLGTGIVDSCPGNWTPASVLRTRDPERGSRSSTSDRVRQWLV